MVRSDHASILPESSRDLAEKNERRTNAEHLVTSLHDLAHLTGSAELLELLLEALRVVDKLGREALLERDREWQQDVARRVLVDPGLDLGEPLVLLADVVALRQVDEVGDGLGGEEHEVVDDVDLFKSSRVR